MKSQTFKPTQNYQEGDLVLISADMNIFTFMPDPTGTFPFRAELVLDFDDKMVGIIYSITEDKEHGIGEITFIVGNEMYYTSWDQSITDSFLEPAERPILKVSYI